MTKITDLKGTLVKEMRILQGDNDASVKKHSYANIVSAVNELQKLDKHFEFDSNVLNGFFAFRPDDIPDIMKKVKWANETSRHHVEAKERYNQFVTLAVEIVSERHPELDTDSDKFGTIVNATVANLISMWRD